MKALLVSLFALMLISTAFGEEKTWRIYSNDRDREIAGAPFTANLQEASTKLAWANAIDPAGQRRLVEFSPETRLRINSRPDQTAAHDTQARRLFAISVAAVLAAHALDISSSYGKRELNPLLQGQGGRFGPSSVITKTAVVAGFQIGQIWAIRRNPRHMKAATWTNFVVAGAITGLAAHNYQLQGR